MTFHAGDDPSPDSIRRTYNELVDARENADAWHRYTQDQIEWFVSESLKLLSRVPNVIILNAGSGGNSLGIPDAYHVQVDLAERLLASARFAAAVDVQALPFRQATFDVVICVGSVLNYCDAAVAIAELTRVLKPGGVLIVEFERSHTLEFLFTSHFAKSSTLIRTFYNDAVHYVWVYADSYISSLLRAHDVAISHRHDFHLLSPLVLRLTRSVTTARKFAALDRCHKYIPQLANYGCNTIWFCSKKEEF